MPTVDPIRYSFRSSLRGASWEFEVAEDGLRWQAGGRSGVIAYPQIAKIRLSYRPISMQRHRFRMDVITAEGRKLSVLSTTALAMITVERQDDAYRAFVAALHARLADDVLLQGGLPRPLYWFGIAMLALVGAALASLFIRATVEGAWQGALFMAAFAALFGWQIGGFVWRNRPIAYSARQLPAHLLP